jgi:hypothetical protein
MTMGQACNKNGRGKNASTILVGKPEGNRPVERSVDNKREDNKDIKEMGRAAIDCITQLRGVQRQALVHTIIRFLLLA